MKNERIYRGKKTTAGRVTVRKKRYVIHPGTRLLYKKEAVAAKGVHCRGKNVMLSNGKSVSIDKVRILRYAGAYIKTRKEGGIPPTGMQA